ncbi:MAG: ABC transporter ATP-binding protein [Pseudomonadota bacterium]
MSELLRIDGLSKRYGDGASATTVLEDFSLEIAPGETVALTGASGSGKSTLLNLIAGVTCADAGTLTLHSERLPQSPYRYGQRSEAETAPLRRRALGYVFQFFNLVPTLTVGENLALALRLAQQSDLWPAAVARLEAMGLGDRLERFPDGLSGGEQQRVAIARALAAQPPLLLADEPTGNLDASNAEIVVETLWSSVAATGAALLIATHDPAVARRADRQLVLG